MTPNDYIECGIINEFSDTKVENVTVHVHLTNKELLIFDKIETDPIFHKGWFSIDYQKWNRSWTSIIRESDVSYISYYTTPKKNNDSPS